MIIVTYIAIAVVVAVCFLLSFLKCTLYCAFNLYRSTFCLSSGKSFCLQTIVVSKCLQQLNPSIAYLLHPYRTNAYISMFDEL